MSPTPAPDPDHSTPVARSGDGPPISDAERPRIDGEAFFTRAQVSF